ncbi:DUF4062 domain-containing protein [Bacillus thuringiensis]|uniref:DUF4062 domain-containing protein n=1 Tax=Bacillus cereus group TaxID=86661 RepID=UPI001298A2F3|nr:DUF4062 domain-containing protein [Bacillus thuringiensis]MEB8859465.1 DUF4062 domain-containing protein [Bacillus cereus]MDR5045726.1 DUF4062 domain-containing protein [Bacillus thuringiensis]MEB9421398.1 DUF4062 domain-containing protein [Bacillus cereus]MEC2469037.1 DUF4062 domain-containing protein [Bacillus cereus]MRC85986.1 DUF4062 domain-containing protein [Bacillus thuringiensis]
MQKKLQVFISSTFTDLVEERQVAVQAVLNAGHIPAGMELFKAADTSQKETIKKWIEESDVYMLILGGRYGSIDPETGKSYTHWEYDYAGELGKPRFAVVITEEALEAKIKEHGIAVTERTNYGQYEEFKQVVLSKISKFYSDVRDIKLTVLESLKEFEKDNTLSGWVSGQNIDDLDALRKDNYTLMRDNAELTKKLEKLQQETENKKDIDGSSFEEVRNFLRKEKLLIGEDDLQGQYVYEELTIYRLFMSFKELFTTGITNRRGIRKVEHFLFFKVSPILMSFGLVERVKVAGVSYHRIQTSKAGLKFFKLVLLERQNKEE